MVPSCTPALCFSSGALVEVRSTFFFVSVANAVLCVLVLTGISMDVF